MARLVTLSFILLVLVGCSQANPEMAAMPPPVVSVSYPLEKKVVDSNTFTGRTSAVESVIVRARVWGYLQKINFHEGDTVKKDDVLFEIDPQVYQAAVDQARARMNQAEAQLAQNASEADRNSGLRTKGVINQEDLDRSFTARATAAAAVDLARADLKRAQLDLDYTRIKAPVSGQTSRAMVTVGNLIQSGESGGTMLTTIVSLDPIYCLFDVDDSTSAQVKQLAEKQKESTSMSQPEVFLGLTGETSFPWRGTINFVDNQNDPATGTLKVRGIFPNPNHVLTPGKFVRVRVPLGEPHTAVLVIDRAIDTDQGQKVIYVVDGNNVIDKRPVQLGRVHEGLREIVKGLRPGELVVVDGLQRVRGGLTVEPHRIDMPHVFEAPNAIPGEVIKTTPASPSNSDKR